MFFTWLATYLAAMLSCWMNSICNFLCYELKLSRIFHLNVQAVIDACIISPLVVLLQNAEFEIKKEAAWAISNATSGGTHDQIKYICLL